MILNLDINEVLRYMGQHETDEQSTKLAKAAIDDILKVITPRYIYAKLQTDRFDLIGNDIKKHLENCDHFYIMAATLGASLDQKLRFLQHKSMLSALALDAAAADAIEKVCDIAEAEIGQTEAAGGNYITGRYSPGYGDYPLDVQPELIRLCDASRKIGLSATDSGILTPKKSVTAIIGVSNSQVVGKKRGCGSCNMASRCQLRKAGKTCGS